VGGGSCSPFPLSSAFFPFFFFFFWQDEVKVSHMPGRQQREEDDDFTCLVNCHVCVLLKFLWLADYYFRYPANGMSGVWVSLPRQ